MEDFTHSENNHMIRGFDSAVFSRDSNGETVQIHRNSDAGQFIQFRANNVIVGDIRNDSGTVSLTGFAGNHESSGIPTNTPVGTVVSTIDTLDTILLEDGTSENHRPRKN